MPIQNHVQCGRGRGLVALVGAMIAAPACFLPVPPVGEDPSTSSESSSGDTSSGAAPTTGGESTSTGEATSTGVAGPTSGSTSSTSEEGESSGTTEFSLPTCPYEPPGVVVSLATGADGDMSVMACGATEQFTRLKLTELGGSPLAFLACSDDDCSACGPDVAVELGLAIPDPFNSFGLGMVEGGCYSLDMKWERPVPGDPAMCRGSTVVVRRFVDRMPLVVPSVLYRLASELGVADEVEGFTLTAASAGPGTIHCPCDGDCCEAAPGTRDVQFTIAVDGEVFMGEPLVAEQAQDVPLEADEVIAAAGISLVRSHVPSECDELPVHEWVLRHPVTR
jgi:hypothetical protein